LKVVPEKLYTLIIVAESRAKSSRRRGIFWKKAEKVRDAEGNFLETEAKKMVPET